MIIALDISGSMKNKLKKNIKEGPSRLDLAKNALIMLIEKLEPNDSFGLIVFNDKATALVPLTLVS
jgi:Mg-chelatase subunit ChlD